MEGLGKERSPSKANPFPWLSQPKTEASTLLWKLKDCFSSIETTGPHLTDKEVGIYLLHFLKMINPHSFPVHHCTTPHLLSITCLSEGVFMLSINFLFFFFFLLLFVALYNFPNCVYNLNSLFSNVTNSFFIVLMFFLFANYSLHLKKLLHFFSAF